jgi:hypothetical protein
MTLQPRARAAIAMLLATGSTAVAGCGEAQVPNRIVTTGVGPAAATRAGGATGTTTGATTTGGATNGGATTGSATNDGATTGGATNGGATGAAQPPPSAAVAKHRAIVARIDASSDAIIAEGKVHIAAGAPSDAEVRHEIKVLRKAGIVLPSGDTAESFAAGSTYSGAGAANVQTPETVWNPRSKPIADWIIPVLAWAYAHGWSGTVTSGYRTYYEQAQLNAAGAFSAPAGLSNHETTVYPGGAVDVTNPSQLISVLRNYPGPEKLIGGVLGPVDPEHFSATGD